MKLLQTRPAETGGVASAIALLIAYLAGVRDAGVITALGVVIGFVPAAITWLVDLVRGRKLNQRGYTIIETLVALVIALVCLVVIVKLLEML